ncbi:MAG: peptidoglycan bridge formation glycyltransferase FemA/FemB family protein [Spirochaetales bacterium]
MDLSVEEVPIEAGRGPHLLQSGFWSSFKALYGWMPYSFKIHLSLQNVKVEVPLYLQIRSLAPAYSLAYVPFGPIFPQEVLSFSKKNENASIVWELLQRLGRALSPMLPSSCRFLRFDLPFDQNDLGIVTLEDREIIKPPGFYKAPTYIQPPDTVILSLIPSEEELLSSMKPKTRYNIRLARKKGVQVWEGKQKDLVDWYRVYCETAERDRIAIHSLKYYQDLLSLSQTYVGERPKMKLFLASVEDTLIGGIVVALYNTQATYLYGASSNQHRNTMASYLLQWEAIRWAKQEGAATYDFFGIPPKEDPTHPMAGLYRFKTGFGGTILHRVGTWDYPFAPLGYGVYRVAEKVRIFYYKGIRKRFH